jgi:hypothetical protein
MNIEIRTAPLTLHLHGFSATAPNKDYAGTAFKLMDNMWRIVKSSNLKNKGLNIWVYEPGDKVFAGVELIDVPGQDTGLEEKIIELPKYAYYKHVGPYHLIKHSGQNMTAELKSKGLETTLPYIEIYGHWTNDETRLETELLMSIK